MKKDPDTSWGAVADWYDEHLEYGEDTYHAAVIAPNLKRILDPQPGLRILDIACGQGYFARLFAGSGAQVTGADISPELIALARQKSSAVSYHVSPADDLSFASAQSFDAVTIVLAIQNIERFAEVFSEASRVLVSGGRLVIVMNHPAFRIPKRSSWGFDESTGAQYRRLDGYLSASKHEIDMHPGGAQGPRTLSYHRSLQEYAKALAHAGLSIVRLEEWISHKSSEPGPRQAAEDRARKEFPLFLMIEARSASR